MRMMALQRRAVAEGLGSDKIDDAMESDDPKAALISLLVEASSGSQGEDTQLRVELEGMRVMDLFRRASSDSALDADKVEQAMDSDDAKGALVSLILAQHGGADPQAAEAAAKAKAREALRAELQGLRVMELFKRATSSGVDTARTEDAMDSDDPKAALTALLLEAA